MTDVTYQVIADDLQQMIESGGLKPGERLKTEAELCEEWEVSRTTIRDAIKLLLGRGLVETHHGRGTFVVQQILPFVSKLTTDPTAGGVEDTIYQSEVERQQRKPRVTRPRVEVQPPPADIALLFGWRDDEDAQVVSRFQMRSIDQIPYSSQTTYYPMDFIGRGASRLLEARDIDGGVVEYLRSCGIDQVGWRDRFTLRPPEDAERTAFGLSDKVQVAMLEVRRTGYDADGHAVRVTITVYAGDRNCLELETGYVPWADTEASTDGAKLAGSAAEQATASRKRTNRER
ncbi:MAG: GntR family transcriptional regulator [Streptosporangiaceae bacterium]